jgi:catalase
MSLKLTAITINRNAHPNTLFAELQNADGESVNVQIHFQASMNVNNFTIDEIEKLAREELKHIQQE